MVGLVLTGTTGLVGGAVARALSGESEVVSLSRRPADLPDAVRQVIVPDLQEAMAVSAQVPRRAVFVHCAAAVNADDDTLWAGNVLVTRAVCRVAASRDATRFIMISTGGVYAYAHGIYRGEDDPVAPISAYAHSKYISERIVHWLHETHGIPADILRLYFPFALNQEKGLFPMVRDKVVTGETLTINRCGAPTIQPVHVDDIAAAIRLVARGTCPGCETYNLCGDQTWTFEQIVDAYSAATGREAAKTYTERDQGDLLACNKKLKSTFGWTPKRGLNDFIKKHGLLYRRC
jgi:nucleoside-diphosphate-sugar epimerase